MHRYYINKSQEFWKSVQMIFLKTRKDLSYIYNNRGYINRTWYKIKRFKDSKSQM